MTSTTLQCNAKKSTRMETFETHIAHNKRMTNVLMGAMILLMTTGGVIFGGAISDGDAQYAIGAGFVTFVGSFIAVLVSYRFGPNILLSFAGAHRLQKAADPELFNVVEEMSIAAGIPMPKIYLISDDAMNAFATGRTPLESAVAITSGLRSRLSRDELQGVIAHEVAHIINFDIRLMMVAGVIGGTIALISDAFLRSGSNRNLSGGTPSRRSGDGGIFVLAAIAFAIIAPFIAKMLQLAVSREREYLADATAVKLTRNPYGLVGALNKLSADTDPLDNENRAMEHLYIVSPTRKLRNADTNSVWSTHPPVHDRMKRLLALAK